MVRVSTKGGQELTGVSENYIRSFPTAESEFLKDYSGV